MAHAILPFASVSIFKNQTHYVCIYIVFLYLYFLSVLDDKSGFTLMLADNRRITPLLPGWSMKTLQETNVLNSCNNELQGSIDAASDPTKMEHAFQNLSAPVPSNAAQS